MVILYNFKHCSSNQNSRIQLVDKSTYKVKILTEDAQCEICVTVCFKISALKFSLISSEPLYVLPCRFASWLTFPVTLYYIIYKISYTTNISINWQFSLNIFWWNNQFFPGNVNYSICANWPLLIGHRPRPIWKKIMPITPHCTTW